MLKSIADVLILLMAITLPAAAGQKDKASQASMAKEAKITMEQAEKTALAKEAGKIQEKELEREKGRLIYSFDIKMPDGVHEVNVDAMTGDVVEDSVEDKASEAKEKSADKASDKGAKKTTPQN